MKHTKETVKGEVISRKERKGKRQVSEICTKSSRKKKETGKDIRTKGS